MTWQNGRLRNPTIRAQGARRNRVPAWCQALIVMSALPVAPLHAEGIAQLYEDARTKNLNNIRSDYDIQISDSAIDEARSFLLPQLSVTGNETFKDPKYDFGVSRKTRVEDYSVNLRQPLFNMQAWGGFSQSQIGKEISELQAKQNDNNFVTSLLRFYLDYLKQVELLAISDLQLKSTEAQLLQAEKMFEGGMIVVTSVHEARSSLDLATSARLDIERNLQLLRQQLYDFMRSRRISVDVYVKGLKIANPLSLPFDSLGAEGYEQNYALQIARKQMVFLEESLDSAYYEYYPTVDLAAAQTDNNAPQTKKDRTLTLTLNVPIYQGGRTYARVSQSSLKVQQQKEVVDYTAFQIGDRVKNLVDNYAIQSEQYRISLRAEESSKKALESLEAGFKAGERTITDVLNAQNSIFDIRQRLTLLKFDMIASYVELQNLTKNVDIAFAEQIVQ